MLDVAARRANQTIALRDVLARHPTARSFLERTAFYLTPELPHPAGVALLDIALRTGLVYYKTFTATNPTDARRQLLELIAGVFTPLPTVAEIRVVDRYERWDPLHGVPLALWLQSRSQVTMDAGEVEMRIASMAPRAIRSALAFHLITPADLAALPPGALSTIIDYPNR